MYFFQYNLIVMFWTLKQLSPTKFNFTQLLLQYFKQELLVNIKNKIALNSLFFKFSAQ